MHNFTKRDYFVAAGIILGVLAAWFLLMAIIFHLVNANDAIFIIVMISAGVYWLLKKGGSK